jgi:quinohemoprotein ethanol dehydrogenase
MTRPAAVGRLARPLGPPAGALRRLREHVGVAGPQVREARFGSALTGVALAIVLLCGGASSLAASQPPRAGWVDAARLAEADREPQNWLTDGRDQGDTYFSPLASINAGNVGRLGFAWQFDLGTRRGQEATPIVVDGVMYTSSTRGYVYALNAETGKELWRFDPHVILATLRNPCCDLVNRGVAVWRGRVYVASVDGRLHALNAATGAELWSADTIVDHSLFYSSTGAPQIAGKVVVVGNGGSDMGTRGVRGYVSAYDLETGALRWRFFTVPPAPAVHSRIASSPWPPRPGILIAGPTTRAAARSGMALPMIRRSTWCISALAMPPPTT